MLNEQILIGFLEKLKRILFSYPKMKGNPLFYSICNRSSRPDTWKNDYDNLQYKVDCKFKF
jgi:hypothetical protein